MGKGSRDFQNLEITKSKNPPDDVLKNPPDDDLKKQLEQLIYRRPILSEIIPGDFYQHFRGKIYSIVTPAIGYDYKDNVIVFQDIKTYQCYVRLWETFNEVLPDGRPRYKKYQGSPKEALRDYGTSTP